METNLQLHALEVALAQVGVKEDPPGSNRGPQVDEYIRRGSTLDPTQGAYAWCACFVGWCVRGASEDLGLDYTKIAFRLSAGVWTLHHLNRDLEIQTPDRGCVFIHLPPDNPAHGHTGFVVGVTTSGDLETCEGNTDATGSRTGGQVMQRVRPRTYAQHFLRVA